MVIELCGIPGSGKTYFSDKLIKSLYDDGLVGYNVTELSRKSVVIKMISFLCHKYLYLNRKYRRLKSNLRKVLANYLGQPAKYNICDISVYINAVVFACFIYDKFSKSKHLFIIDEGICQQLSNMIVNFDISDDAVNGIFLNLTTLPKCILLETEVPEAIHSIEKRNRHVCFIDEFHGDKLVAFAEKYKKAVTSLKDRMLATIKRSADTEENVLLVRSIIKY